MILKICKKGQIDFAQYFEADNISVSCKKESIDYLCCGARFIVSDIDALENKSVPVHVFDLRRGSHCEVVCVETDHVIYLLNDNGKTIDRISY